MFSETFLTSKNVINSAFRSIIINIDHAIYGLLELVYQLFFNVASSENVFSNATVIRFYGRVQLILGVFMMFQLALIILRGIVNPDSFTDKKSGAGNLITRVVTALVLLTVLVPINVPKDRSSMNEYEKKISGNGLLFGTLYSLQHRLLTGNTIGKLVLGSSAADTYDISSNGDELMNAAKLFSATVARGFYRINLIPYDQREHSPDGFDEYITENRVCQDMGDALDVYKDPDSSAGDIIGIANETCSDNAVVGAITGKKISSWLGNEKYMFAIMPFISTAAAIVFIFIFISFSVDVAVRAIKLAVLRLIAPIPIISYMDPKGSKDSSFNSWVKSLTSTYLDLFVRLAIIYFVLFLIQDMIKNGSAITRSSANGSGILGVLSMFIIWIGLFVFAKQAPKFIRQILGLKDDGGGKGIFSGLGTIAALGAAVGGTVGSGIASYKASKMADETRAAFGMKTFLGGNKAKHILSGITGGIAGGVTGARAGFNAKDHTFRNTMEAMQKRNAEAIAKANDGSTMFGRIGSSAHQFFTGDGSSAALSREVSTNKARIDALKAIKSRVSGEMVKKDWTSGDLGIAKDRNGNRIGAVNFKHFESELAAGRARGDGKVTFRDVSGTVHEISLADAERQRGFLLKNNEDDYIVQHVNGTTSDVDSILMTRIHSAEVLGGSSDFTRNADGTITKGKNKHISDRKSINDAIEAFEDYNTQLERQNAVNKANDRYSGKK